MKFKTDREKSQFIEVSLILKIIANEIDALIDAFRKEMVITRVYDAVSGESGVHLDKRAIDIRDEHGGVRLFTDNEISIILKSINEKWVRNDGKQTVIHHKFGGGPFHLHVQIPSSTKTYEPIKTN